MEEQLDSHTNSAAIIPWMATTMEEAARRTSARLPASSVVIVVTLPTPVLTPIGLAIVEALNEAPEGGRGVAHGTGESRTDPGTLYHTKALPHCTSIKFILCNDEQTKLALSRSWRRMHFSPMCCDLLSCRYPDISRLFLLLDVLNKVLQRFKATWPSYDSAVQSNRHHLWLTTLAFFQEHVESILEVCAQMGSGREARSDTKFLQSIQGSVMKMR